MNQTEKDYLSKVNFWMLILCLVHIPIIAGVASYFDSGVMQALLVGGIIGAGPLIMFGIKKEARYF